VKYNVLHETVYGYESPVVLSQQLLHLTPRVLDFQTLLQHHIAIDPAPAETRTRDDYFGNPVTQILLAAPHGKLSVNADSRVEVAPRPAPSGSEAWEEVRNRLRRGGGTQLDAVQFMFESPHVELFRDLATYAEPSFARGRNLLDAVLDLTRRIHGDFTFDPKATSVSTPLREVLGKRRPASRGWSARTPRTPGCRYIAAAQERTRVGWTSTPPTTWSSETGTSRWPGAATSATSRRCAA